MHDLLHDLLPVMAAIKFFLVNKKSAVSALRAVVSFLGEQYHISPGISVPVEKWQNGKLVGRTARDKEIQKKIAGAELILDNAALEFERRGTAPTHDEFKHLVSQLSEGGSIMTFRLKEDEFISWAKKIVDDSNHSYLTKRAYYTTFYRLERYEEDNGKIYINTLNDEAVDKYREWLIKQGLSKNSIGVDVKNIKALLRIAKKQGKSASEISVKTDQETADSIYLTKEEVEKLRRLRFTDELVLQEYPGLSSGNLRRAQESLENARCKFLVGICTALRVSDYNAIQQHNIKDDTITILPKKGSGLRKPSPVVIPMHPILKEILESGYDITQEVSSQRFNEQIKLVCKMAGITDMVATYRTQGGSLQETVKPKYELVTSHTARRTAATLMTMAGIPKRSIMMLTGHKSERNFEKYVRLSEQENAEELRNSDYFKDENSNDWLDIIKKWRTITIE